MAGGQLRGATWSRQELRPRLATDGLCARTPCVKDAAGGRSERRWHLASQDLLLLSTPFADAGNGGEQSLRVGMTWAYRRDRRALRLPSAAQDKARRPGPLSAGRHQDHG